MVMFTKKTGKYLSVLNELKPLLIMRESLIRPSTKEAYLNQLNLDLNRMRYFNEEHSIAEMQRRLRDISHLYDEKTQQLIDPSRPFNFMQGDFYAGLFSEMYVKMTKEYFSTMQALSDRNVTDNEIGDYINQLGLSYIDDDGELCALSFVFFRNIAPQQESDPSKLPFAVFVIRKTNAALIDREVTAIIHPDLVSLTPVDEIDPSTEEIPADTSELSEQDLVGDLEHVLKSKKLSKLIRGIIVGDSISRQRFDEISKQIAAPELRDSRIVLLSKLVEKLSFVADAKHNEVDTAIKDDLLLSLMTLIKKLREDLNFANHLTLESIEKLVEDPKSSEFFRRLPDVKHPVPLEIKEALYALNKKFDQKPNLNRLNWKTEELNGEIQRLRDSNKFGFNNAFIIALLAGTVGVSMLVLALLMPVFPIIPIVGLALIVAGASALVIHRNIVSNNEKLIGDLEGQVEESYKRYDRHMAPKHAEYDQQFFALCEQLPPTPQVTTSHQVGVIQEQQDLSVADVGGQNPHGFFRPQLTIRIPNDYPVQEDDNRPKRNLMDR